MTRSFIASPGLRAGAVRPPMPMRPALLLCGGHLRGLRSDGRRRLAGTRHGLGRRLRRNGRSGATAAGVASRALRPALAGRAARTPDLDQFRFRGLRLGSRHLRGLRFGRFLRGSLLLGNECFIGLRLSRFLLRPLLRLGRRLLLDGMRLRQRWFGRGLNDSLAVFRRGSRLCFRRLGRDRRRIRGRDDQRASDGFLRRRNFDRGSRLGGRRRRFAVDRRSLGRRCGLDRVHQRGGGWARFRRRRRLGPLLHAVAERAQDRGEVLADAAGQRGHADGDGEAASVERAGRLRPDSTFAPGERGPDQVGETLENVDAHGALAADAIADDAIERLGNVLVDGNGGAAARGKALQLASTPAASGPAVLERPELQRQSARRRLEQRRHSRCDRRRSARRICATSRARADRALFSSSATFARSSTPSASTSWKAMPRARPVTSSAAPSSNSGADQLLDVRLEPEVEPRLHVRRAARR